MLDKVRVSAIQRLCVNDGPGVRTTVFLKGCYLRCPWCCNPEAMHYSSDTLFDKGCKFTSENKVCDTCEVKGGKRPKEECPLGLMKPTFQDLTSADVYKSLMRDKSLFCDGGGVTFSGGEPLMQARQILPLLKMLKQENISIAFETTLYAPISNYLLACEYVDYWIVDLKFQLGYISNGKSVAGLRSFASNIHDLQERAEIVNIEYRMVALSEMMQHKKRIVRHLLQHRVNEIHLLDYHAMAENKYIQLAKPFHRFSKLSESERGELISLLLANNIKCYTHSV